MEAALKTTWRKNQKHILQDGQRSGLKNNLGVHVGSTYQEAWNVHAAILKVSSADFQSKDFANETKAYTPRREKVVQVG